MKKSFHGSWIVFAACITFGLSTGIPYYNIGFFYDYIARDFNWSREQVTLGFPLAAATQTSSAKLELRACSRALIRFLATVLLWRKRWLSLPVSTIWQ